MKGTLFIMQFKAGFKYEQYMNGIKRHNFLKTRYGSRKFIKIHNRNCRTKTLNAAPTRYFSRKIRRSLPCTQEAQRFPSHLGSSAQPISFKAFGL